MTKSMNTGTGRSVSGSVEVESVSLKEYFMTMMNERQRAIEAALSSANLANEKAEKNIEEWRKNANEWRGSMNDREQKFVTKEVFEARQEAVEKQIAIVITSQTEARGAQRAMMAILGIIVMVTSIGGALAVIFSR